MTWFGWVLIAWNVLNLMLTPFEAAIRAATPRTPLGVVLQMSVYVGFLAGLLFVGTGAL